jgi:DNA repair protein RadC
MDGPYRYRLHEIPPALRPRERLLAGGARALTSVELVAILLGAGTSREGVLQVAERVVRRYGVGRLPDLTLGEWVSNHGIGRARACQLLAAFELAKRSADRVPGDALRVCSPREAFGQVRDLARAKKEHLVGLYLDAQNCLIARETLSIGTLNTTRTHPREVLHPAIHHHALGFILAHNHPSGNLTPSRDDVEFTRAIRRAGEIMGIDLYDHLIVGAPGFVSLKERGLI